MKIAVEITIFGHRFSEVVDYPGTPHSQAEVIRWLMNQTEFRWVDYEHSRSEERILYELEDGVKQ